jgi:hypothetical protein
MVGDILSKYQPHTRSRFYFEWGAIARARRHAIFVPVDPMLARIPSQDTHKAPATEGVAEFDRTQTEQKLRHPNRPQKLHRLGYTGPTRASALAEFILSLIPQHAVSSLGPRRRRCSQVKHRLTQMA